MKKAILSIEGLRKSFGKFVAIDGIDLNLRSDMITSLIGPNGAGKTTLINLITGSLRPDKGKVFFKGDDITRLSPDKIVKKKITRSFQVMNIFPRLTVFQNIELPILPILGKSRAWFSGANNYPDVTEEVNRILEEVGLLDKRDVLAGELSHGDQRLLELAIALAPRPELCFLDEPSSGTNPAERAKVLELIKRLSVEKKTTFVVVEHDMDVVLSLSDWIVVMNRGKILAEGKTGQIRENKEVREIYLGEEVA
ncbi:Intermembrane phospholipid transport system ATP-binding protein MlaF [subsurface metagenome]